MNKIFKSIWNRHRGCFVAVSEAMTSAGQRAGKAACIVAATTLLSGNALAVTVYEGDYYKISGPYNNTQDYSKDSYWILNGNYFHLGEHPHGDHEAAFVGAVDSKGRGYNTAVWDVNGNMTIKGKTNVKSQFNIGWTNYQDNASGTLNVSGDVLIGENAYVLLAGLVEDKDVHSAEGILNVNGTMTIESGGELILVGGGNNAVDGTVISTVNAKNLLLSGTVTDYPGLFPNKTVTSDHSYENAIFYSGSAYHTSTPLLGTRTTTFGTLTLEAGSTLYNITPVHLANKTTGTIAVTSTLNLNGGSITDLTNFIQNQGTLNVNSGAYYFGTLNKNDGTISNVSSLSISNFNQIGGTTTNSGTLTVGNANLYGSLNNTGMLTLTGNVTSRGNLSSSGTLNNQGTWTEANAFNIAGTLNNTGTVNFQNGFSFASNGKLNSSGTVKTSNAGNIFDSLGSMTSQELKYVSLGASTPQAVRTSLNNFFKKYLPGSVSQTLAQHASFTGGKVIVTGVNLTQTQADDLTKAFKAQFFLLSSGISASAVFEQC